jgi:hypothetical protein
MVRAMKRGLPQRENSARVGRSGSPDAKIDQCCQRRGTDNHSIMDLSPRPLTTGLRHERVIPSRPRADGQDRSGDALVHDLDGQMRPGGKGQLDQFGR